MTGEQKLTSRAYLTFVAVARDGARVAVPPLLLETDEERRVCAEAQVRRTARLLRKEQIGVDERRRPKRGGLPSSRCYDTFLSLSTLCSRSMPTR